MFELPSLWNLLISTVVFFVAVGYLRRTLDEQGIPSGTTRGLLVFVLAYLIAWGAGAAVDWTHDKLTGTPHKTQSASDLSQLLKSINPPPP
ncbi:MAG TPA: hypothetical protein DHV67_09200 [Gallionella sp.]|nr:hypothetical protein [Gallionella sp.]PJC03209.1 MAG: hypothetical protein CO070_09240 [Gallionellales bacterium CG_4_9_14_0_8_um_filter_55_61]HCJ52001.1 hypothetical protein [Gallionella sp.]